LIQILQLAIVMMIAAVQLLDPRHWVKAVDPD